ncbi:hypothetical protein [Rhodanobacter lindaniclasticus]
MAFEVCSTLNNVAVVEVTPLLDAQRVVVEVSGRRMVMQVSSQWDRAYGGADVDLRNLGSSATLLWPRGDVSGVDNVVYGMASDAEGLTIVRFPVNREQGINEVNGFAETLHRCTR